MEETDKRKKMGFVSGDGNCQFQCSVREKNEENKSSLLVYFFYKVREDFALHHFHHQSTLATVSPSSSLSIPPLYLFEWLVAWLGTSPFLLFGGAISPTNSHFQNISSSPFIMLRRLDYIRHN